MGNWKYFKNEKSEFLFNLKHDPAEKKDLQKKNPAVFNRLKKKYIQWELSVLKPVPL